jgi:hypothetical protein
MTHKVTPMSYQAKRDLIKEVDTNTAILDSIKENIYCEDGILKELDRLNRLDQDSDDYKNLYQKVIQVGEYENN